MSLSPLITVTEDATAQMIYLDIQNPNERGTLSGTVTLHEYAPTVSGNLGRVLNTINVETDLLSKKITIPTKLYYDVQYFVVTWNISYSYVDDLHTVSISEVCENTKARKFSPVASLQKNLPFAYLKAFCNMPNVSFEEVYVCWEYSFDGISWKEYDLRTSNNIDSSVVKSVQYTMLETKYNVDSSLSEDSEIYVERTGWRLNAQSPLDNVLHRPDIIRIPSTTDVNVDGTLYRIRMFTIKEVKSGEAGYISGISFTEKTTLGSALYTPVFSQQPEIIESDISNVSESKSLYNGAILYAFGNPDFRNYLVASYPGETVRPQSRLTPLDISENSYVTAIVPWKNYLICFTERTIHLVSVVEDGFIASTVNTFIGIPETDSKCCIPTLNGVIFKSNAKIYLLYPNIYAGSDSVLNVTEVSSFIETYLEEYENVNSSPPFAIGTDSEYILMLPMSTSTTCLRYSYSNKRWTTHEYPFVAVSYEMLALSDVRILGYIMLGNTKIYGEYVLDASYDKLFENISETQPYTDCVRHTSDVLDWERLLDAGVLQPIPFAFDSGQKADNMNQYKQFVESKFNLATLHEKDSFPMQITIHVDGCPYVTTKDVNTDSAFWKESTEHLGTLNTSFITHDADTFNVFRQMFIRYSGKGRSVRHIIEGESLYPFKIYEINYRYRNLNVKQ